MSKKSNVKWKSYQPSIVSVDSKGKVKGLKSGTSRIEARTKVKGKEYVDVYEVKVVKNNIMSIAKIE